METLLEILEELVPGVEFEGRTDLHFPQRFSD